MDNGIGEYAYRESVIASDVDHYRHKYRDIEKQTDGTSVSIGFVSPVFITWEEYRYVLLQHSQKIHLKHEWKYRPDYVSYEYYGTTNWWQLILWINNVNAIEYFNHDEIIVPDIDSVNAIQNEVYSHNSYIDINEDFRQTPVNSALYISPLDNLPDHEVSSPATAAELLQEEEEESIFQREKFTMDIPILRLKYVDLKHPPVESSIRLIAKCKPNLIFKKHYDLISDGTELKRITWDPEYISNGGLLYRLKENDILEIQYVYTKGQ